MRPLVEYTDMYALMDDLRKEGLFEKREAFLAQYDRAKKVKHVQARIIAFIQKEKQVYRSFLWKRLRLDRDGKDIAEEALNQLFVRGAIYVTRGPVQPQGGRRGVTFVFLGEPSDTSAPITDCPVVRCAILGPHTHEIGGPANAELEEIPEEFGVLQPALINLGGTELTHRGKAIYIKKYKETHSCVDCTESEPACLDFHHREPKEKLFGVTEHSGKTLDELKTEIDKCDLVCASCHRKRHKNGQTSNNVTKSEAPSSLMPSAILEEVQSNSSSEIKVPQPKTLKSALVSALTAGK